MATGSDSGDKSMDAKKKRKLPPKKREGVLEWDDYFMGIAFLSAQRSKDPRTQVGACIVNKDKKIVGTGYNGMPNGCSDNVMPWAGNNEVESILESKKLFVCHAEMNAVVNKNSFDVKDCTIFVSLFPCNECAKLMIQSGIKEVVYCSDKNKEKPEAIAAKRLFDTAKVVYNWLKCDVYFGITNFDKACDLGSFGLNCSSSCHCRDNSACNNVNGTCESGLCEDGWRGNSCSQECESPKFGTNCSVTCHCLNNTNCNNVNGSCIIGQCEPGWTTHSCSSVCSPGYYGENCSMKCHCLNNSKCTNDEGHCAFGMCAPGWQGQPCNIACPSYFFGMNCSKQCGECKYAKACHPVTGTCPYGCEDKYNGDQCLTKMADDTSSSSSVGPIVGGTIGIIVCLIIVIVLLIMNYRRQNTLRSHDAHNATKDEHTYTQPNMYLTPSESSVYDTLDLHENQETTLSSHIYVNDVNDEQLRRNHTTQF